MAPPVRLLPSAGSLTSHEAPVLVTDSAEPWKQLLLINSICRQWFTHISVFGLQGWKSFRYRRCTVNIWGRLNIRKVETKERKSSNWCCVYLLGIGVLPLQQGSLSSRGRDLKLKLIMILRHIHCPTILAFVAPSSHLNLNSICLKLKYILCFINTNMPSIFVSYRWKAYDWNVVYIQYIHLFVWENWWKSWFEFYLEVHQHVCVEAVRDSRRTSKSADAEFTAATSKAKHTCKTRWNDAQ